jgi:predicted phage replisome organizer
MPKKYYWLKLKNDFFTSKAIKKLRKTAGGDTFVIIYLKMQLLSLQNEGKIFYDGIEEDFASEIALTLDEDPENVKLTMAFLQNHGLLECNEVNECFLTKVPEITGKESDSAQRMRKHRIEKSSHCDTNVTNVMLQCNTDVTKCDTEIEIEKETEKEIEIERDREFSDKSEKATPKPKIKKISFGEYQHIKLTQEQYDKLCEDYGENFTKDYIRKMDEWLQIKGKNPYKDFNLALRNWLNKDNIKKRSNDDEFFYRYSDPDDRPF